MFVIPEGNLRWLLHSSCFSFPVVRVSSTLIRSRNAKSEYQFWVYILSNRSHILYIGVTNNLNKRVHQHRQQKPGSFTARFKLVRLVYVEQFQYIHNALARDKEMKHWTRAQKITLIEAFNPTWEELLPDPAP